MWTRCSNGHRHWGHWGAAGLLLVDGPRFLLQHRSQLVHHGSTWSIPGGARSRGETALTAALREAREEAGPLPELAPFAEHVTDCGGWQYVTILARAAGFQPAGVNLETGPLGFRWVTDRQASRLPLHPALAVAWPELITLCAER